MDTNRAVDLLRAEKSGIEKWNVLRAGDESLPDLSGANLSRCDLCGVDLHGLRLMGAFFGGSRLDRADLSGADLSWADMPACRLCKANLTGAVLSQANLRSADVAQADFTDADLRNANLLAVNLSSAVLHVADSDDVRTSMDRADRLPLHDDIKQALFEILQKMDILDDLNGVKKREVADRVDDLIRELLKSPPNPDRAAELFDTITEIAPPLVADVPKHVFLELDTLVEAALPPRW